MKRSRPVLPQDSFALPGMETADSDRQQVTGLELAAELSARMLEPLGSIDSRTGEMERRSPLFFGSGCNPSLFTAEGFDHVDAGSLTLEPHHD